MKRFTHFVISGLIVILGMGAMTLTVAPTSYAAPKADCSTSNFLTFPAWYRGLINEDDCTMKSPSQLGGDDETKLSRYIWRIVLNVLEIALQVVGYAAVAYLIYGGYKYLVSTGSPDKITAARKTIQNALIGLILSFMSVAIVATIAGGIK
ncbi:hypothetical protein RAAC3_TM7C00001G0326 [Candidatus Saccharibacteria bacterium RAAC3_TM7_1]|nr:hypothetical protein RAAC3_TM7C00001G0326 [Candidatus Saccharibacteria bacterium RAAC3_TM7_1]HCZ28285.1 hypothetical protein [Candidatus Saccharibacteria bacterium]